MRKASIVFMSILFFLFFLLHAVRPCLAQVAARAVDTADALFVHGCGTGEGMSKGDSRRSECRRRALSLYIKVSAMYIRARAPLSSLTMV